MRTKDRLAELKHLSSEAGGAVYADTVESARHERPPLPAGIDAMLHQVERMRSWIHELNGNTQLLRRLHADPTFHTNKHLQEQLESVIAQSNATGLKVCGALKQFESVVASADGGGGGGGGGWRSNSAWGRIARLQYAATRALSADALAAHHAALAHVRDERRALLHEQIKLTNLTISDEECESLLESKNLSLFVDNVKAETSAARRALREVEARHEELTRVEGALREVRDLFAHLAILVATQQEQIDSVEYYALQATEHVESGGHELLKGTVLRTKTRRKKTSVIICVAVGVFVVLLVLAST